MHFAVFFCQLLFKNIVLFISLQYVKYKLKESGALMTDKGRAYA